MAHDNLVGAGITPKERLERIEVLLTNIDEKLDTKTSQADHLALALKVEVMQKEFIEHKVWATGLLEDVHILPYQNREEISRLKNRIAYAAGVAAVLAVVAEAILNNWGIAG